MPCPDFCFVVPSIIGHCRLKAPSILSLYITTALYCLLSCFALFEVCRAIGRNLVAIRARDRFSQLKLHGYKACCYGVFRAFASFRVNFLGLSFVFAFFRAFMLLIPVSDIYWCEHMFMLYFLNHFLPTFFQFWIFSLLILFVMLRYFQINEYIGCFYTNIKKIYAIIIVMAFLSAIIASYELSVNFEADDVNEWDRVAQIFNLIVYGTLVTFGVYYTAKWYSMLSALLKTSQSKRKFRKIVIVEVVFFVIFSLRCVWNATYLFGVNWLQKQVSDLIAADDHQTFYWTYIGFYFPVEMIPLFAVIWTFRDVLVTKPIEGVEVRSQSLGHSESSLQRIPSPGPDDISGDIEETALLDPQLAPKERNPLKFPFLTVGDVQSVEDDDSRRPSNDMQQTTFTEETNRTAVGYLTVSTDDDGDVYLGGGGSDYSYEGFSSGSSSPMFDGVIGEEATSYDSKGDCSTQPLHQGECSPDERVGIYSLNSRGNET